MGRSGLSAGPKTLETHRKRGDSLLHLFILLLFNWASLERWKQEATTSQQSCQLHTEEATLGYGSILRQQDRQGRHAHRDSRSK